MRIDYKKYIIKKDSQKLLSDFYEPITNLLFLLRNNYEYIIKVISLIDDTDDIEKIDSLIELFVNQFYDNILIPNHEPEELLILICILLKKEIEHLFSSSIDGFLDDNSFIGRFISSYIKSKKLNLTFINILNPLIISIENSDLDFLDMSLYNINYEINRKKEKNILDINIENSLEKKPEAIKNFKKYYYLENNQEEENVDRKEINSIKKDSDLKDENSSYDFGYDKVESFDFNSVFKDELNFDKINERIESEEKEDIKDFYLYLFEEIGNYSHLYTNERLKIVLNYPEFKENKPLILKHYYENFSFIKKTIDYIIQELINRINEIPFSIRYICKFIFLLISKKFPLLPKFLRNAFLGKFLFDKCIFPILSFENKIIMALKFNTIQCIKLIISILSNANKCCFYPSTIRIEKTILNYYLIEIIPKIYQFYEKLIEIVLPKTLESIVNQNIEKEIFQFKNWRKKFLIINKEKNKERDPFEKENKIIFNSLKENKNEIMNLKSICFSLYDVLYIIEIIKRHLKIFKDLPQFELFNIILETIESKENKLYDIVKNNYYDYRTKIFFIIFRYEGNYKLEKILNKNIEVSKSHYDLVFEKYATKFYSKKIIDYYKY